MFMFQTDALGVNRGNQNIVTASYRIREGEDGMLPAILRQGDDPNLGPLRDNLREEFNRVIFQAEMALQPDGNDSLSVGIYGQDQNGQDVRIYVPRIQWDFLDADRILNAIDTVLNSAQSLLLDFEIRFTVVHVPAPPGQNVPMLGGVTYKGDLATFLKQKRGVVKIHPPDDPYSLECLWQFCTLGLLWLLFKNELYEPTFHRLHLMWNAKMYNTCIRSASKYEQRHKLAQELMAAVQLHEPTPLTSPFAILAFVEQLFHVRIVLYNFKSSFSRIYPLQSTLPVDQVKPTFFGLLTDMGTTTHVDYVSIPEALCAKDFKASKRVCLYCFEIYGRSRSCGVDECQRKETPCCSFCHVCSGLCETCCTNKCGRFDSENDDPACAAIRGFQPSCGVCKRRFFSNKCKELHEPVCALIVNKRCDLCGKPDHRSLKCNEMYCMMCSEKHEKDDVHECFLRMVPLNQPITRYWCYDFETALDVNGRHVLYLCTAWSLYPMQGMETLKKKYTWKPTAFPDQPVFIFWGLEGSLTFFDFIMEEVLYDSHFFAHNGGRYDTIFIEYYMTLKKGMIANKIQRGLNELQLVFPQLKIRFKDSRNFINTALRNMSADFGIQEMKKGYFPHKLVTVEWLQSIESSQFISALPQRSDFEADFAVGGKGLREKAELEKFLDDFYATRTQWNMKEDAVDYCISDTLLLGETLRIFREDTMEMTKDMARPLGVDVVEFDPLLHVTLPSAVMKFYLGQMLPAKTIPIIDRYPALLRVDEEKWLLWMEFTKGVQIVRESFFLECQVSGVSTTPSKQTILYRFLSCYDWGCTECYRGSAWNVRAGKTFHHLWNQYIAETQKIRKHQPVGTRVIDCWTHQWYHICDSKEFTKWSLEYSEEIERKTPMDPREAYKGGISELYKLHVPGKIQMADFVSQYPTSMVGQSWNPYTQELGAWGMPTGSYARIVHPKNYEFDSSILGVLKCTILPPSTLYAPFLGYRVVSKISSQSYEVLYGNCRLCMENRLTECTHTDDERAFTGTWTIVELCYAIETLGYKVLEVIEVWEYEQNNTTLFKSFMIPFIVSKTCCKRSGLVDADGTFTEKGRQTSEWLRQLTGHDHPPDNFVNAPSKRNVAKLIMNSFYGKWGQRSQWSETKSYKEEDEKECMKLFENTQLLIHYVEVIHQHAELGPVVYVDYEQRLPAVKGCAQKNDHIAAHITAYGRMMINYLVQKMGQKSIYVDTDSLFHTATDTLPYTPGFRIGDLELELPDASCWTGCGRKWYSYRLPNGDHVAKQKGIALKASTVGHFTPEKMLDFMHATKAVHDELCQKGDTGEEAFTKMKKGKVEIPQVTVPQNLFKTVQESKLVAYKKSVPMLKNTTFLLWSMKRIPQWEPTEEGIIDTVPFGYRFNSSS